MEYNAIFENGVADTITNQTPVDRRDAGSVLGVEAVHDISHVGLRFRGTIDPKQHLVEVAGFQYRP